MVSEMKMNTSKHIWLCTDDPGVGGVAQYNQSIIYALNFFGFRVTYVQTSADNTNLKVSQKSPEVPTINIEKNNLEKLLACLTNPLEKPELIICSNSNVFSNFLIKRMAMQMGIPYLIVEGLVEPQLATTLRQDLLDEIARHYHQAKSVIAVSFDNLNLLHQLFKLPPNKGQVIYYGRPSKYFQPCDFSARDRRRQELGIPPGAVVCFTAARIEARKGYLHQLEAIKKLRQSPAWPQLYFVWAGGGIFEPQLENYLKEAVQQLGITDKVKFLGQLADVSEWLNVADIFVFPSYLEGMPLCVMEAMAKGLPIIATAVSGIPEELGGTGKLLADPKIDPEATVRELVAAIQEWALHPELRRQIGQNCQQRAQEMFKEERMIKQTLETIERGLLPARDYVSPGLAIIRADQYFPNMIVGDPKTCAWQYLRQEIPHNWYVDKRQQIIGFLSRDEAHILYNTALKFKGKKALEIGCWLGWSACHLALAGVDLDVIDPVLERAEFSESVTNSLQAAGVFNRVNLIGGYSPQKVEELAAQFQRKWSLIFIDGNHEAPGPLNDAISCEQFAEADALIVFHDLASPDVAQGLDYLKQRGWNTMIYQTMQIMGVAWRGNVEPIKHQPDPQINWQLPPHLQGYYVSGMPAEFQEILAEVRPYTLLSEMRLYSLYSLAKQICLDDIPGNFVECGTCKGGSAALLAAVIKRYSLRPRLVYACDTFEGMPDPTEADTHNNIPANLTGLRAGTLKAPIAENLAVVCRALEVTDMVVPVKGFFEQTLPQCKNAIGDIAFLHADGDWYESTMTIFNTLYDRVVCKGLVQVDDYGFWQGCKQAIHDFERQQAISLKLNTIDDTGVWFRKTKRSQIIDLPPEKSSTLKPTILIDGVFFQLNSTGIARLWQSVLAEWAANGFAKHILVLDRAGTAPKIPGIRYRTVLPYDYSKTEADRQMLQQVCDEERADLLISTYYTTPISTPSVFMGYDMIPEVLGQNLEHREWREKHLAIRYASAHITISENTARDLVRFFPHISPASITVAHCGINPNFSPASPEEIEHFKTQYSIAKPYLLLVGERIGWKGYKNGLLFFQAFSQFHSKSDFEIVCTGGSPSLEEELKAECGATKVHLLRLSDEQLRCAYSGAVALVYPSAYEGFGLPVLEAMACGCPTIACPNASIPEVAGTAALYVNYNDVGGLVRALGEVLKPEIRQALIAAGLERSKQFSWSKMAQTISSALMQTVANFSSIPSPASVKNFKTSAVVSTYNSESFIRGCLEDLIDQTLYKKGELEIIVIDSHSEQNEGAIVREFQAKYPHIIYHRTEERETIYAGWNRGIKMAHGCYITNANADDRHRPDALEIMVNYLDAHPEIALVYGDQLITNVANDTWATTQAEKRWNWPDFSYSELERRCLTGSQPMWRKSLHDQYGYFRAEFASAGDYEFWLRICQREKMARIPEILGLYYYHEQGLEHGSPRSQQETVQIWDEYGILRRGVKPATSVPIPISPSELNSMPYRVSSPPPISVIIPCYNHATFLRESVESLANQTYQNWECIIVNDGSTDDTSELAKYLRNLYPTKTIFLIEKPNTGPADSRNVGVQQSSGNFILFLDADDKLHPKFLEECLAILLASPQVGFVYTDVQNFGFNCDLVTHGDFDANRFLRNNQVPATSLFRREIFQQVGGLKPIMKLGCEDWEFWIAAYEKGWQGYRLPKPYLYYRQHGDGSSRTQKMASDRPKLDLMRAVIINLHSQLYTPAEVNWSEEILRQHGSLISDELGQLKKSEPLLALISKSVEQYQQDQTNQEALNNLRKGRKQLADYWLSLSFEQAATAYAGEAGKVHAMLLNSTLRYEALTEEEKPFVNQLADALSRGFDQPNATQNLLAAMLYRRADQLPLKYQRAPIPNWFVTTYLQFMLASTNLFQEIGEADNYSRYLQEWVSYLHTNIFSNLDSKVWQDIARFFTQAANFIPLYFNHHNLRDIYAKRAEIMEFSLKHQGAQIDWKFPERPANRQKIRVGILTKHFGPLTETFATLPAFEHLNREQFEIILYSLNLNGNPLEQYCQSRADRLVNLPNELPSQVQTIRADDLDILLIGTNISAVTHPITLLALHRLARVQTTCFNSPITTGMRNIDYYIAGKLMEPTAEAQDHYCEQLVTLDGPGVCFSYSLEPYTCSLQPDRKSLGIPEEAVVFISSANLYKLLPELRETWAKILAAVPNSMLLLMPFGPSWTNYYPGAAFANNMHAILAKYAVDSRRLRIFKALPNRADVKAVLKLGDIYLDSYPYAGTTSLVDPLEVGLPAVVWEGNTLRSKMGAAVMRSLDINDLIVNNESAYIQVAVTLATNPGWRQQKRQEIQHKMQQNPAFLDSRAYSLAMGSLFQKLFKKWQNQHQSPAPIVGHSHPEARQIDSLDQPFLNQLAGCVNLYQIDPSAQSVVTDLRQIRKRLSEFWLTVPPEQLESLYQSQVGKGYQTLLTSGIQNEPMTESEQVFLQQLTLISKGLVHPKAINSLLAAMLYFPPGTMRVPDARSRLPQWLIGDYEKVFESGAIPVNSDSTIQTPTLQLQAQYISSPPFLNQLLGCTNLYHIDPSDQSVVMELRQMRKQIADFWVSVPPEQLENIYQSDVGKGYKFMLVNGIANEPMIDTEQAFLQSLIAELGKGLEAPKALNHLLAAMLYCLPGQLRVQDAQINLPRWLWEDYEKFAQGAVKVAVR